MSIDIKEVEPLKDIIAKMTTEQLRCVISGSKAELRKNKEQISQYKTLISMGVIDKETAQLHINKYTKEIEIFEQLIPYATNLLPKDVNPDIDFKDYFRN